MPPSTKNGTLPASLQADLLKLGQTLLNENQAAVTWLATKTANVVSYSDPTARARVQSELDNAVAFVCVAHLMTLFEDHFPEAHWVALVEPDDLKRLLALKHLKACTRLGINGRRVPENAADFDAAVSASPALIPGVISSSASEIRLSTQIAPAACACLQPITQHAVVAAHP